MAAIADVACEMCGGTLVIIPGPDVNIVRCDGGCGFEDELFDDPPET